MTGSDSDRSKPAVTAAGRSDPDGSDTDGSDTDGSDTAGSDPEGIDRVPRASPAWQIGRASGRERV